MRRGRLQVGKLPFAHKEQDRDHAAHPESDKNSDESFDPSPFPPIGFQVPHHILAVGSLPLMKLERLAFEA
jgi:hypothetical protein